jgi:hypothetical protein
MSSALVKDLAALLFFFLVVCIISRKRKPLIWTKALYVFALSALLIRWGVCADAHHIPAAGSFGVGRSVPQRQPRSTHSRFWFPHLNECGFRITSEHPSIHKDVVHIYQLVGKGLSEMV